jgi:hypothetical protein
VDGAPEQPGKPSGELDRAEICNGGFSTDGGEAAEVAMVEWAGLPSREPEYDLAVSLRYGVAHRDEFRNRVIVSPIDEPPSGLEKLRPVARKVDRLLDRAAKTVWALVEEQQQPALAAIRQRFDRF